MNEPIIRQETHITFDREQLGEIVAEYFIRRNKLPPHSKCIASLGKFAVWDGTEIGLIFAVVPDIEEKRTT